MNSNMTPLISVLGRQSLFDCTYIEKENNGIYTCVVRRTNEYNREFYKRLRNIKIEWDKK